MARSRRLTDGTRWRIFIWFLRLDYLMASYTNAGAPERAFSAALTRSGLRIFEIRLHACVHAEKSEGAIHLPCRVNRRHFNCECRTHGFSVLAQAAGHRPDDRVWRVDAESQ